MGNERSSKARQLPEKRRYAAHRPREEYLSTATGRDLLPVLFMIGALGRQYRADGKLVRFQDTEQGTQVTAVAIVEVSGARTETRPIRVVRSDEN